MRKLFYRLALFFSILIVGTWIISFWFNKKWGRDVATLDVHTEKLNFKAKRDASGVWNIKAPNLESLFFAHGYIQALDREFQTELIRRAATGRLTEFFGESVLSKDRMMRFAAEAAKGEWQRALAKSPHLVTMAESYVLGRNEFLKAPLSELPIEYKVFQLDRSQVEAWQAWEVFAIARFHAWEFSYDLRDELLRAGILENFGVDYANWFLPPEPADSKALYGIKENQKWIRSPRGGGNSVVQAQAPVSFFPSQIVARSEEVNSSLAACVGPSNLNSNANSDEGFSLGANLGASNSWIIAEPKMGLNPTLCNDTHLATHWPSPLYPVEYELEEPKVRATGFMLPGLPILVTGSVEATTKMVWGVTIANFVDGQDLVQLSPKTLQKSVVKPQDFLIRNPKTLSKETKTFKELWTPLGPRVDEFLPWATPPKETTPLALDWLGFRDTKSLLEFFYRRNLYGPKDLRQDLLEQWDMPSANFSWIEWTAKDGLSAGHMVPGIIFDHGTPSKGPVGTQLRSESQVLGRKLSYAKDRPFLFAEKIENQSIYIVSGNQRVWPGQLGTRLAYQWNDGTRAERLLQSRENNLLKPEYSQTDYHSKVIFDFIRKIRSEISADRLCSNLTNRSYAACVELMAALDSWDGGFQAGRWEPTLAALWYLQTAKAVWPVAATDKAPASLALFKKWIESPFSRRSMSAALEQTSYRSSLEKKSGVLFLDSALRAFQDSLDLLLNDLGPETSYWTWGRVHKLEWQHVFAKIPGALGPWLRDSLLGPAPAVSGGFDTPGYMNFSWNPTDPLNFDANKASVSRMCMSMDKLGAVNVRWTNLTGVSGNPMSPYAWSFARDFYFKGELQTRAP